MTRDRARSIDNPAAILGRLETLLLAHGPLALAVSGGVDSMTLAVVTCRLNPGSTVFHALSPAVPAAATARVRQYAADYHWELRCIDAGEMQDPAYRANPGNRCYFCKGNLYRSLRSNTTLPIAAGTNLDDLDDYRPGLLAAREQQVVHPLVETGMTKHDVRKVAALLGLQELHDLPASPCLSSRITTGIAIDADLLPLIDRTEQAVRKLLQLRGPQADLRCRIRDGGIDIELPSQNATESANQIRDIVQTIFCNTRFSHYCNHISIMPYRRGSAFVTANS